MVPPAVGWVFPHWLTRDDPLQTRPNVDDPSLRPSSRMILGCLKLVIKTNNYSINMYKSYIVMGSHAAELMQQRRHDVK